MGAQFQESGNNRFMVYRRSVGEVRCAKKLCFTSTDLDVLVATLDELTRRADCAFAKYSLEPRAAMYLGRCFLDSEDEVGRLWAKYKAHPKMFCQIQDDEFTNEFRALVQPWDEGGAEPVNEDDDASSLS